MIRGYINENGVPVVNVTVGGIRSQITIPAVVDTGFDGHICLPTELAVNLGLELIISITVELADGSMKDELVFYGTGSIGDTQREIEIILTDSEEALLGLSWFTEGSLYINFHTGELIIEEVIEQ